jgi:UDP:flavonoid glycosyltransferase YjiC (YdhE family)
VIRVLGEPTFRNAAEKIRDSFRAAGGASAAADSLVGLA